jgi:serine/threonine protein kinase
LEEDYAKYFFRQMIETLIYINSKGIAHRDIKLENMLVNDSYQLKFADFGFASFSKEKQTQQKGTPIYIAPEIINNTPYIGEQVDVFSCGVVLFAMISGKYPFSWAHPTDKKYKLIMEHCYNDFWKQFEKYAFFSPLV